MTHATNPATIVLVHGLWMTPSSWDTWAERYRALGHTVIVPGWPGIDDRTPQDVRSNPTALEGRGITEIVDSYERVIRALPDPPIIMGHSFGGIFIQMLLDRGCGRAGVGVAPGQPAGVLALPWSTLRTGLPILANPFRINKASRLSKGHFHYTFGNDLTRAASDQEWEASAVNAVNRVFFEGVLSLPRPKNGITKVDFAKPDRAPLLLISGGIDHVAPAAIQKATLRKYAPGPSLVERIEFPGRTHRIVSQDGWEEVADYALQWALDHSRQAAPSPHRDSGGGGLDGRRRSRLLLMRVTRIGGPSILVEIDTWRILIDPTFDPPGRRYPFALGTSSVKTLGPSIGVADLGPIDLVLVSHDHHADNLDTSGRALLPTATHVLTTAAGAERLAAPNTRGLHTDESVTLRVPGKAPLRITATPCRHGPPLTHPIVGDVIGFAIRRDNEPDVALWVTGDTVLYPALLRTARTLTVDVAIVNAGGVGFPLTGPLKYTMTGADAIRLITALQPRVALPAHYDGWSHFRDGENGMRTAIRNAPAETRNRIRWLPDGQPVDV